MLRLSKIVKSYKETGALSENISIFGFLDEEVFLTKAGDVGVVMRVEGVDYECLDHKQTDDLTKRLESALRLLGPQYRVYQFLFKAGNETIPFEAYENPVVKQQKRNGSDRRGRRLRIASLISDKRRVSCTRCKFTS